MILTIAKCPYCRAVVAIDAGKPDAVVFDPDGTQQQACKHLLCVDGYSMRSYPTYFRWRVGVYASHPDNTEPFRYLDALRQHSSLCEPKTEYKIESRSEKFEAEGMDIFAYAIYAPDPAELFAACLADLDGWLQRERENVQLANELYEERKRKQIELRNAVKNLTAKNGDR